MGGCTPGSVSAELGHSCIPFLPFILLHSCNTNNNPYNNKTNKSCYPNVLLPSFRFRESYGAYGGVAEHDRRDRFICDTRLWFTPEQTIRKATP